MKKMITLLAFALLLAAGSAYAGAAPATGVYNSKHDMNVLVGLNKDPQGRVCAFCHTPHHAVDLAGAYNPLWSHQPTAIVGVAYASSTFDAGNQIFDPLVGPSRLCMSCHDGAIAPDQHYGSLFTSANGGAIDVTAAGYATSHYGGDDFGQIAVGLGGAFGNDHPIGFDVLPLLAGGGTIDVGIRQDLLTRGFYVGAVDTDFDANVVGTGKVIGDVLYTDGAARIMTCATCHDVHNKDNVLNDATTAMTGVNAADHLVGGLNYFVYAPQNGSQLCLSCHDK